MNSLFSAQPNQQQNGGLFGAATTQQIQPPQIGGLFSTMAQNQSQNQMQQPQQTGGMFSTGQSQPQTSSQLPQAGGVFGSSFLSVAWHRTEI